MTFAVIALVLSCVFTLYVFTVRRIPFVSNYTLYYLFSVIYSLIPVLTFYGIEPKVWFTHAPLHKAELLVATQTVLMATCNVVFASVFCSRRASKAIKIDALPVLKPNLWNPLIWISYMALCALMIAVSFKYGYTSGNRTEMIHSAISNLKVLLASIYVVYLVCYGFNRGTLFMFLGYVALLMVEQSRWYFFTVLVATALYLQNTGRLKAKHIIICVLAFALLLSYVGLYRMNVDIEDMTVIFSPIYFEGDYSTYPILQTYDLIYRQRIAFYTLFADYIIDPILYEIPRPLYAGLGLDKDSVGIFYAFIETHKPCLGEKFSPLGGLHYIAQSSSALPFAGPLIVTCLFAMLTIRVQRNACKSKVRELLYYLYSSGFVFVFVKVRFDLCVKYFITLAIPALIIYGIVSAGNSKTRAEA